MNNQQNVFESKDYKRSRAVYIAESAFEGSQLTSIAVSKNVTKIVYRAFAGCYNLENISLPTNLKSILKEFVFTKMTNLRV